MPRRRYTSVLDKKDWEIVDLRGRINSLEQLCKDYQAKIDALEREKKEHDLSVWARLVEPDEPRIKGSASGDLTTSPKVINRVLK